MSENILNSLTNYFRNHPEGQALAREAQRSEDAARDAERRAIAAELAAISESEAAEQQHHAAAKAPLDAAETRAARELAKVEAAQRTLSADHAGKMAAFGVKRDRLLNQLFAQRDIEGLKACDAQLRKLIPAALAQSCFIHGRRYDGRIVTRWSSDASIEVRVQAISDLVRAVNTEWASRRAERSGTGRTIRGGCCRVTGSREAAGARPRRTIDVHPGGRSRVMSATHRTVWATDNSAAGIAAAFIRAGEVTRVGPFGPINAPMVLIPGHASRASVGVRWPSLVAAIRASRFPIAGYAVPFHARSNATSSGRAHIIERGAFDRALAGPIYLLRDHTEGRPSWASTLSKTLHLEADAYGVWFEAALPDTPDGRDLHRRIRFDGISGVSIGWAGGFAELLPDGRTQCWSEVNLWELSLLTTPRKPAFSGTWVDESRIAQARRASQTGRSAA